MVYSEKCLDLKTRWNLILNKCVPCPAAEPGYEIAPNCGYDDFGGRHEVPHRRTQAASNSTTSASTFTAAPITTTSATTLTAASTSTPIENEHTISKSQESHAIWPVLLSIITITSLLVLISICVVYMRRKRGRDERASLRNTKFPSLSAPSGYNHLEEILSPDILSAPLQTVLDHLDVLEELVILLDPESRGVKNTKHLASHCSFPSTWITYTYSMRDTRSPLVAVLEGVTSRNPDWTVGHLAKLLRQMERNDAIAVLSKLRLDNMDV